PQQLIFRQIGKHVDASQRLNSVFRRIAHRNPRLNCAGYCDRHVQDFFLRLVHRSYHLAEILMYEGDRNRTFADAGRDPLDRTVSHIADYKDARHVRFQKPRIAVHQPAFWPGSIAHQIATGKYEPMLIAFYDVSEPLRVWSGTDEDEQRGCGYSAGLIGERTVDGNCVEMILTMRFDNRGIELDLDVFSII